MEQPKAQLVDERTNSASFFQGRNPAAVELPEKLHSSSDGSEHSSLELQRSDSLKTHFHRRSPGTSNRPVNTHRRYKSYPAYSSPGGLYPVAALGRVPQFGQEKEEGQYPLQQLPLYHPWVAGYDLQWSAYGMYVLSTVMSKRSEKPTRIVFIGNLAPAVEEKRVIEAASKYGPIRGIDASLREYWFGMFVSYWDTRHAEEAVRGLSEHLPGAGSDELQQIPVTVCFMLPPGVAGMENQGQLTVKIADGTTSTELRKLFAEFGEVKSVRSLTEDSKTIEFFDARAAEAALRQIKTSKFSEVVLDVEYTKQAPSQTEEPVPPMYTSSPKAEDSMNSDTEVSSPWHPGSYVPHPWGQYPVPQRTLQRQNSAPAAGYAEQHGVYSMPRPEAIWGGHYMGYHHPPPPHHGMQPWGYGSNPQPVPMVPVSSQFEGGTRNHGHRMESHPGSPNYESHGSENQNWRPHRTRSAGDRVYDPAQFQFNVAEAKSDPSAARTTLMIRNIPNKYSQKMLLDVLNKRYR